MGNDLNLETWNIPGIEMSDNADMKVKNIPNMKVRVINSSYQYNPENLYCLQ